MQQRTAYYIYTPKTNYQLCLLWLLCLYCCSSLQAQNFGFQSLTTEQGLTQNSVSALQMDPQGFMWIGTQDGLNRFDGDQLVTYRYQAPQRPIHNIAILDLAFDPKGNLYILGNFALEKLSLQADTSTVLIEQLTQQYYTNILWDPLTQKPLVKSNLSPGFTPLDSLDAVLEKNTYQPLAFDQTKDLLFAYDSYKDQIRCSNLRGKERYVVEHDPTQTLKEIFYPIDQHQIICNIQRGEKHTFGLARIGPEGMSMQKPLPIADVRRVVYQASQERYCMVTAQGDIWLLDQSLALIKKITAYQQRSNQVPSFYISEALIHQGYLWVGVDPLGVLYRSLGQNQFSTRKFAQEPPAIIKNIFTDSNKHLYAYVLGKGLQVFGPDGDVISDSVDLPPPLRSPDIFAGFNGLEQVGPDQFVLSGKSVFGKLDLQTMSWTDYLTPLMAQISDKESSQLYLFYEALGDQDALVASGHCLYDFQLSSKQFQKRFCLDVPITFVMAEETGFWIGTTAGLYQCQGQDCRALPSYQGSIVKDIRRDADGRLLVATSTGLYVQTEELRIMDQKSGLGNSYVYGSLTDDKGFIWVSTNQGLSQIDPRDWSVRNYSKKDGISATEFNSYGYWKAPDGVLYFSGIGGITRIAPGADKQFQDSIPLVLTGLAINDRLPGRLQPGDELVRLSSDQNTITIHFQELLLPSQEKLLYEYQLAGFDKHWVVSDQSAVRYPQLPPGRYTFRLKLANQEQTTEQSLQILIALPLYRQSWFLASLLGLLFLGLGVAWWLYHRRQQQRQEEQQKQQAALEGERRRISRELHDNMGAHTTALISNIQRLQQQSDSPARSQQLDRMQQDAKNILSSLRDTIWILNNKKIYLTELIDNVKMFALRLSGHQSQYQLVVNEKVEKDVLLEASQVVHLKAMLQEIIHNTIKHADGDQIVFNIWVNEQIELHLIDNGKGFRAEETMAGQGLENLQWRAREIHCQMEFKSSEQGTHYQLKIPLAPSKKS